MITNDCEDLPNPYKDCLREMLTVLVIHDNDVARINCEMKELKEELKEAIKKLEEKCDDIQKVNPGDKQIMDFTRNVARIDDLNECFQIRIKKLLKTRDEKMADARLALKQLNLEKQKMIDFHEKSVEYLKKLAVCAADPMVIKNCEKDIAEMHSRYVKEVTFIKKTEASLKPFYHVLQKGNEESCDCCCLKDYKWIPKGKDVSEVAEFVNEIKDLVGKTMVSAFARLHVTQPANPKMFLANYLMNTLKNEAAIQEKFEMFGGHKCKVVGEESEETEEKAPEEEQAEQEKRIIDEDCCKGCCT